MKYVDVDSHAVAVDTKNDLIKVDRIIRKRLLSGEMINKQVVE